MEILLSGSGAIVGVLVGAVARRCLSHMRRGTRAPPGLCEIIGAALSAVLVLRWPALPGWWVPVAAALTVWAVPLLVVDLRCRRLPDALTLPAYPVVGCAVAIAAVGSPGPVLLVGAAAGAAVFVVAHLAVRIVRPQAMGAGDVKLSGAIGIAVGAIGWPALVLTACLASMITALLAVAGAVVRRWRDGVPHGPGLLLAAWTVVLGHGA